MANTLQVKPIACKVTLKFKKEKQKATNTLQEWGKNLIILRTFRQLSSSSFF